MKTPREILQSTELVHLKKILVPTDFSDLSEHALQYALRFSQLFGAEIVLLHVFEPNGGSGFTEVPRYLDCTDYERQGARQSLNAMRDKFADSALRPLMRTGFAATEIVDAAKEIDVDLIVIATHGYTGWKHFCIGSTAEQVVRTAGCPVLVVREKEHEFI